MANEAIVSSIEKLESSLNNKYENMIHIVSETTDSSINLPVLAHVTLNDPALRDALKKISNITSKKISLHSMTHPQNSLKKSLISL